MVFKICVETCKNRERITIETTSNLWSKSPTFVRASRFKLFLVFGVKVVPNFYLCALVELGTFLLIKLNDTVYSENCAFAHLHFELKKW